MLANSDTTLSKMAQTIFTPERKVHVKHFVHSFRLEGWRRCAFLVVLVYFALSGDSQTGVNLS